MNIKKIGFFILVILLINVVIILSFKSNANNGGSYEKVFPICLCGIVYYSSGKVVSRTLTLGVDKNGNPLTCDLRNSTCY